VGVVQNGQCWIGLEPNMLNENDLLTIFFNKTYVAHSALDEPLFGIVSYAWAGVAAYVLVF